MPCFRHTFNLPVAWDVFIFYFVKLLRIKIVFQRLKFSLWYMWYKPWPRIYDMQACHLSMSTLYVRRWQSVCIYIYIYIYMYMSTYIKLYIALLIACIAHSCWWSLLNYYIIEPRAKWPSNYSLKCDHMLQDNVACCLLPITF